MASSKKTPTGTPKNSLKAVVKETKESKAKRKKQATYAAEDKRHNEKIAELDAQKSQQLSNTEQAFANQWNNVYNQIYSSGAAQRGYYQSMYDNSANEINSIYDRSANNAYVNYRQGQRELPEQLSSLGATGGASESAAMRLQAAYGQNLADVEANRSGDLSAARQQMIQGQAGVDAQMYSALNSAYVQNLSEQMARQQEIEDYYDQLYAAEDLSWHNKRREASEMYQQALGKQTEHYYDDTGLRRWYVVPQTNTNKNKNKNTGSGSGSGKSTGSTLPSLNSGLSSNPSYKSGVVGAAAGNLAANAAKNAFGTSAAASNPYSGVSSSIAQSRLAGLLGGKVYK